MFGEFGSHGAEVFGDQSDAIGLFDAEFACVAYGDAVAGVRGDGGENRQLVDDLRGESSFDVHTAEAVWGNVDLNGAYEFAVVFFDVQNLDLASKRCDDIEQGGPRGIHADSVEDEVGVRKEQRS